MKHIAKAIIIIINIIFPSLHVNGQSLFDGLLRSSRIGAKIPQTSFGLKTHEFRSDNSARSREKEANIASNLPFLTVVDDSVVGMY